MRTALFSIALLCGCDHESPPASSEAPDDRLPANLTKAEETLIEDVRTMFRENDPPPMTARIHDAEGWLLEMEQRYLEDALKLGLGHLELVRIDPPRLLETLPDGAVAEWNLPLKWELVVHHPGDSSGMKTSHTLSLSEHEGRIVIVRQVVRPEAEENGP